VRCDFFVKLLLHFSIFLANASFDLVTKYILRKKNKQYFNWYIVHTEILQTSHAWVEYISVLKYTQKRHSNQLTRKNPKPPLPRARGPRFDTPMPEPTPLTNNSSISSCLSLNYTTKSPLVTMGHPSAPPKLPLPLRWSSLLSNTPIRQPTILTTSDGIQIQSAVFPQFTHWTYTQAHRPTIPAFTL